MTTGNIEISDGIWINGWELTGGWIALVVISSIAFLASLITGIVFAAKTEDKEIKTGRLLLHLFLWGWTIAAIVYAIKAGKNRDANYTKEQLTPYPKPEEPTKDELLKRIEELEKKNKK